MIFLTVAATKAAGFGPPEPFLGWLQQLLADKAIVSLNAVARLEKGILDRRVSAVLALAKVEFLSTDQKGEGVRLKAQKAERVQG